MVPGSPWHPPPLNVASRSGTWPNGVQPSRSRVEQRAPVILGCLEPRWQEAGHGRDGPDHVWDPSTGQSVREWRVSPPGNVKIALAWSPDGERLASLNMIRGGISQDYGVTTWEVESGKAITTTTVKIMPPVSAMAWSPDGGTIATASSSQVTLWDSATGQERLSMPGGCREGTAAIAWSPDGRRIAIIDLDRLRTVVVRDAATGKEVQILQGITGW